MTGLRISGNMVDMQDKSQMPTYTCTVHMRVQHLMTDVLVLSTGLENRSGLVEQLRETVYTLYIHRNLETRI